ncbi:hypothetical protein ABBQ38_004574 [Trebouxia sp. C0009 RCD-2024]
MDEKASPAAAIVIQPPENQQAEVIALQPVAVVDHLCSVTEEQLRAVLAQEQIGGSRRISQQQVQDMLAHVGEFHSKAGGSNANTIRGLAAGFGVHCELVGARGKDEWGAMFASSMKRSAVGMSKMRVKQGQTGRCVIFISNGQRTMRTCLGEAARMGADDLSVDDFKGAKWLLLSGYCCYGGNLLQRAVDLAAQAGVKVALDLASFEIVQSFKPELRKILEARQVHCCFCNEDEAAELLASEGQSSRAEPEEALAYLSQHCELAVVTLGDKGCIAQRQGDLGIVQEHACSGVTVLDATGAGDLFASGFLYGILRQYSLQKCCQMGCLAGGAIVQTLGAEMTASNWKWLFDRLHGALAASAVRDSATAVHHELLECYALIEKLGRGVVYYGSARLKQGSPHWGRAVELGRQVAQLLGCTTWSGGGPGMMEAATAGAQSIKAPVGGIRISREAGTTVRTASYLPADCAVFCRFLSSRKVALVDSGVRSKASDLTAYIFLPGGLGTMDELFEIMTLVQLKKLGSKLAVPLILCNYDDFYDGLMNFLSAMVQNGTVGTPELTDIMVASSNQEVLDCLASFYNLPRTSHGTKLTLHRASSLIKRDSQKQLPDNPSMSRMNSAAA